MVGIGIALSFLLAYLLYQKHNHTLLAHLHNQLLGELQRCLIEDKDTYTCWDRVIKANAETMQLDSLFHAVRYARKQDGRIENRCHQLMHSVGAAVYKRTQDMTEALHVCIDDCTFGCHHAAVAEAMRSQGDRSHATFKSLQQQTISLCSSLDNTLKTNCAHGVGHALMIMSDFDESKSIRACEMSEEKLIRYNCYQGVYMETFGPRNKKFSFDPAIPSAHCDTDDVERTRECYQYLAPVWISHFGIQESVKKCMTLSESHAKSCVRGAMLIAYHSDQSAQKGIRWCERQEKSVLPWCIEGFVHASIIHHHTKDEAFEICKALSSDEHRLWCSDLVMKQ